MVEAFAVIVARAKTDGDASKREHELKMDAQRRRMITSIIGMVLLGVMIATMVALVQMHMLDETTIQKLAIVVLALLNRRREPVEELSHFSGGATASAFTSVAAGATAAGLVPEAKSSNQVLSLKT